MVGLETSAVVTGLGGLGVGHQAIFFLPERPRTVVVPNSTHLAMATASASACSVKQPPQCIRPPCQIATAQRPLWAFQDTPRMSLSGGTGSVEGVRSLGLRGCRIL